MYKCQKVSDSKVSADGCRQSLTLWPVVSVVGFLCWAISYDCFCLLVFAIPNPRIDSVSIPGFWDLKNVLFGVHVK